MNSTLFLAVFRAPQFVQTLEAVKLRCGVKQGLDTQHSNTNCITLGRSLKETAPIIIFFWFTPFKSQVSNIHSIPFVFLVLETEE